jgi:V8-like Glu-specific endopeptidase
MLNSQSMLKIGFASVLTLSGFQSQTARALPRPGEILPDTEANSLFVDGDMSDYDFTGIVKLYNCSGSLVRFESSKMSDKAMVLTNGHCVSQSGVGFIQPNQYIANLGVSLSFKFLNPNGTFAQSVDSTKIIYATMTGSDMALYQLAVTYDEIKQKYNVPALTLSSTHPFVNEDIEILSGYWQTGYSCKIDQFIFKIKEDAYVWNDSIRYSREGCHPIHGTSGSPVLDKASRKVVAIHNTGNNDGEECSMNNPCEVSESGHVSYESGISYAQETYIIYSCLNDSLEINLDKPGCKLFH